MISRRQCLHWAAACSLLSTRELSSAVTVESIKGKLPSDLPAGVAAIIVDSLNRDPASINTDWFGSLLIQGLLQWSRRGISEVQPFSLAWLDRENGRIYQEQALYQLRVYTDMFLVKETGLTRTILLKDGLGKTYWTRATGWLLWAITSVLRYLPRSAAEAEGFLKDLRSIANGLERVQDVSGGFYVLLDEPSTPLETTGTVMIAVGLHESIHQGWLPDAFNSMVSGAWQFAKKRITDDGRVLQAYTGWAVPAEKRVMSMDEHEMEWIPGFILSAASTLS
jgi:hypothetical protein